MDVYTLRTSVADSVAAFETRMDVSNAEFAMFAASSVLCAAITDADNAFARGSTSVAVDTSANKTKRCKILVGRFGK